MGRSIVKKGTEEKIPEISVIAPVYGVEKYIHQFVNSVLQQTYTDFEFILVDDGSPDNCPAILDEYAKRDNRIKVIHQKNGGVSVARNTGIDTATGKYIYIVDSDDWLESNALELLHDDAERTGADVVMGDCVVHRDNGRQYRRKQFSKVFYTDDQKILNGIQQYTLCQKFSPYYSKSSTNGYAAPWGKFIKASLIKENHIYFDPSVKGIFDDGLFSLEVAECMKSFYYGMNHVYNYRINENSITQRFKPNEIDILRLGFGKVEEFIRKNHKEKDLTLPYYCHVVRFLIYRLSSYFFNPKNEKSDEQIKKEFFSVIKSEPFHTAIRKSSIRYFSKRHAVYLVFLKLGWYEGLKYYHFRNKK